MLPADQVFVVAVSGVSAQKTQGARGAYNQAADRAARLLTLWRERSGRPEGSLFEALASSPDNLDRLRDIIASERAIDEGERAALAARLTQFHEETFVLIPAAFAALAAGDLGAFGDAVLRSQRGAERGLANQIEETIALADLAREAGALAASAFGAGFGGSVWALVPVTEVSDFTERWRATYTSRFDHPGARFLVTSAGPPLLRARL